MNYITNPFKTKTNIYNRKNEFISDAWGIALDIGYSAVKGFSPNKVFCFPAYAKKVSTAPSLGNANETDIIYTDNKTGDIWMVGEAGQKLMDSKANQSILYGRNRYFAPLFRVISAVGLGIGLAGNEYGNYEGKRLVVQTGLPPAYIKSDTELLKEALAGEYDFTLKVGNNKPLIFKFILRKEDIFVMPQPMGTLFSIATAANGSQIMEAKKYFNSNLLIFDPGFGTLDIFNIRNRYIESYETYDDLGMKEVFERTVEKIYKKYQTEVSVSSLQNYLNTGEITVFDREKRKTETKSFANILQEENRAVCSEALKRIDTLYDNLVEYKYLVVTGGTGVAWLPFIKEYYGEMSTLNIISGNQNDTLSSVFANVRGYYMYLFGKMRKENH